MKLTPLILSVFMFCLCTTSSAQHSETIALGKIKMQFTLNKEGIPSYEVYYDNKPVILPSGLGFKLNVDSLFYTGFQLSGTEKKSFDQTWQSVWGETKDVRNHYEELTI
ncbi:MAG TPA: glycoside hydrolase family 97 N-terminal domain-containing protein, partial [Puia sp.]|nr:glycoside hydrolase family 97 N-terminal domain-containing protein [Puia sp.]